MSKTVCCDMAEFEKVTRVELIVNGRRRYNTWAASHVSFSLQDNERTLKLFLKEEIKEKSKVKINES